MLFIVLIFRFDLAVLQDAASMEILPSFGPYAGGSQLQISIPGDSKSTEDDLCSTMGKKTTYLAISLQQGFRLHPVKLTSEFFLDQPPLPLLYRQIGITTKILAGH